MKKIIYFATLFFSFSIFANSNLGLNSKSHILVDFTTGTVLSEERANEVMSPASLTKIVTAYTILSEIKKGNINKDDIVKISENAVRTARRTNSSRTFLEVRHTVTLHELLKGLLVQSGNDAAIALAEHTSGTEDKFTELMNYYVKQHLGLKNSNFRNASGLPAQEHYTTASDLSVIIRDLIKEFPEDYAYYFSMKGYTYNNIFQPNRNRMLFRDENFDGIKTGWTNEAGYCYASSLIKDGRRLIIVTMNASNSESRFQDSVKLANYGYNNFENVVLTIQGNSFNGLEKMPIYKADHPTTPIIVKEDIVLTLRKGQRNNLSAKINIEPYIIAPVAKNTEVGKVSFYLGNDIVAETSFIVPENIFLGNWKNVLVDKIALSL